MTRGETNKALRVLYAFVFIQVTIVLWILVAAVAICNVLRFEITARTVIGTSCVALAWLITGRELLKLDAEREIA